MKLNWFKMKNLFLYFAILSALFIIGCDKDDDGGSTDGTPEDTTAVITYHAIITPDGDYETALQEAMITVPDGGYIKIEAGTYEFTNTISGNGPSNVSIVGAGMNETILDFANQTAGGQGLELFNMDGILMADFTVQDAAKDGIKAKDCDGISFINIAANFTGTPDSTNGAYGLYPVSCHNVLVDGCYVYGASDAGIYVGQSEQVHVKNSEVEYCVAGIEVENCINSDVWNNNVHNNTGGILCFDLPGLETITNGANTRIFDNTITDNSYRNFAPSNNIVGQVPPGTGIMVLGSASVEIFGNTIDACNIMGVGILSYDVVSYLAGLPANDPDYDGFAHDCYVHNNTYNSTDVYPEILNAMGTFLSNIFSDPTTIPDVLWDGIMDDGVNPLCVQEAEGVTAADVDAENFFVNVVPGVEQFDCEGTILPAVEINAPTKESRGL